VGEEEEEEEERESAMTTTTAPVTADDVREAAARLEGVAHRTPVVRSRTLDAATGATVLLKCENLQRGGAFKFRGAYNTASQLTPAARSRGLAAYSSGNHAQAVALAARLLGTTAVILMPEDSPRSKMDAVRGYGAEVVTYDRYTGDRAALGRQLAEDRGLVLIPPYEHPHVIAGQGTAALELLEEVGDLDVLVVPVGGGGLAAGSATIATALCPEIRVVGVEPEAADDTRRSLEAGHRERVPVPRTIADGLAVDIPGELTFSINRRLLDRVEVVSDDQLRDAMRFAFDRLKIVVEPSGAAGLAAVLARKVPAGARVGVVLSGGNVDVGRFLDIFGGATPPGA
jgi:threonine dehydratase